MAGGSCECLGMESRDLRRRWGRDAGDGISLGIASGASQGKTGWNGDGGSVVRFSSCRFSPPLSLLLLLIGPSPRSRAGNRGETGCSVSFNWSMAMGWSSFPGSPTVEISNSQSSVSCRPPLSDLCCCQTTNPKTPARRSLVEDQEKETGQDLGQRVLEGFDPCFHATAGMALLFPLLVMMLCLRPQPLPVVLPAPPRRWRHRVGRERASGSPPQELGQTWPTASQPSSSCAES